MIELWHCPDARSFRPLWALEELGLPYELHLLPFPPRVREPALIVDDEAVPRIVALAPDSRTELATVPPDETISVPPLLMVVTRALPPAKTTMLLFLVTDRPELVTPELTVTVVMRRRPSLE